MSRFNNNNSCRLGKPIPQYERSESIKLCIKQNEIDKQCECKAKEEPIVKHEEVYTKKEVIEDINPQKKKEIDLDNCKLKHVVNCIVTKERLDKILNKKRW